MGLERGGDKVCSSGWDGLFCDGVVGGDEEGVGMLNLGWVGMRGLDEMGMGYGESGELGGICW